MIEEKCRLDANNLNIITLGNFNVFNCGRNLTDEFNSSLKIWDLFKYLVTFRDELVLPEKILDSLWPEAEYTDPKRTLRALIFRLRKVLNGHNTSDANSIIVYSHGCYKLETKKACVIDVVEFEKTFHEAYYISKEDADKAIEQFKKVVDMYKGEYLSGTYGHDWLLPARNHYRRIFLHSVYEMSELLKEQKRYLEILPICEKVLKHEMFEEEAHFRYIEALAAAGKIKQAKNHYKYVEDIFEREMGVKPSDALRKLYRLLFGEISKNGIDISTISESLREEFYSNGPMLCEPDIFKFLYQLEKRRSERYGQTAFLGLLTLSMPDYTLPPKGMLKNGAEELRQVLLSSLRKGDVVTEWNEAQFLLSLPGLNVQQAHKALDRIQNRFMSARKNINLVLQRKIEEVLPSSNFFETRPG
ncbi:AfsR/SARP family transcriptional regulator [Desulfitibacter alkalitolerans]|uniref:AfsR/SARP family transcriptional regulator n=1 Tax=Desulfitibacter alkalitolerans TaxID=264641 RepID=UPI0004887794|nr:BTAD domain-containing putative transcriptional regulator [Desulfitibacter alkalitolerans]